MRTNRDHQFAVEITKSASEPITLRQRLAEPRRFEVRYEYAACRIPALNDATDLLVRMKGLRR